MTKLIGIILFACVLLGLTLAVRSLVTSAVELCIASAELPFAKLCLTLKF